MVYWRKGISNFFIVFHVERNGTLHYLLEEYSVHNTNHHSTHTPTLAHTRTTLNMYSTVQKIQKRKWIYCEVVSSATHD